MIDCKYLAMYYINNALVYKNKSLDTKASFDLIKKYLKLDDKYRVYLKNQLLIAKNEKNPSLYMIKSVKDLILAGSSDNLDAILKTSFLSSFALFAPNKIKQAFKYKLPKVTNASKLRLLLYKYLAKLLPAGLAKSYYLYKYTDLKVLDLKKQLLNKDQAKTSKITACLGQISLENKKASKNIENDFNHFLVLAFYKSDSFCSQLRIFEAKNTINPDLKEAKMRLKRLNRLEKITKLKTLDIKKESQSYNLKVQADLIKLAKLSKDEIKDYIYFKKTL